MSKEAMGEPVTDEEALALELEADAAEAVAGPPVKTPDWHEQPALVGLELDPAVGVEQAWQPQGRPGESPDDLSMEEWVGQALGAASACWGNLPEAGVFDSTRCVGIAKGLNAHIDRMVRLLVEEGQQRLRIADVYYQGKIKELTDQLTAELQHACAWCGERFGSGPEAEAKAREHVQATHAPVSSDPEEPMLGLATTRDLLGELALRFQVPTPNVAAATRIDYVQRTLTDAEHAYRTVDEYPPQRGTEPQARDIESRDDEQYCAD